MTFEQFVNENFHKLGDVCILYDSTIVRLVGLAESECDYYYKVQEINGRQTYYASAVGHLISLKGCIPKDRYDYMNALYELNGMPPSSRL